MKKYVLLSCLAVLVGAFGVIGPQAYADDTSLVGAPVPPVAQIEAQFEYQLNVRQEPYGQPRATSYYDDLVDHYEQVLIMSDFIDRGIR